MSPDDVSVTSTRQQRRAVETRSRVLEAAVETLVEAGYARASTHEIQRRAGMSRGRLLHHYASRSELLVAAAQHLATSRLTELVEEFHRLPGPPANAPERIDHAVEMLWRTFQQPHFWAAVELWIAARHNDELAAVLGPQERELYAMIRPMIDTIFGPTLAGRPRYRTLREVLFTSMRGVALTYAFERRRSATDAHLTQWKEIAHALL
jgi:AcrR family transcriptional regulator